jgi:hypothetical protein
MGLMARECRYGQGMPFDQALGRQRARTVVCAEEMAGTGRHVDGQEQQVAAGIWAST